MGISLTVAARCPVAEMVAAYRREGDAVRRSHLQVIWLLLDGMAAAEVSRVTGFGVRWIEKLIHRWNGAGLAGLGDRRRGNAGRQPVLDAAGRAVLTALLDGAPPDGGLWSGRKVAAWMSERLGRPVDAKLGLVYLHRLGFSLQRPRPKHARSATPEERAAFKKNSAAQWRRRAAKPAGARSRCGPSTNTGSG
ncbi:MAG: winged helix-turn-helix domain-containing protein [Proteobacteria bacterium]|nr:winged helix-turn-helix domain-containing protein [Pseudomonadota bacterium]